MNDTWYFANKDQSVGPFKLAELEALLRQVPSWEGLMVWGKGFSQWQKAGSVPEILALFDTPPPIPTTGNPELRKDRSGRSSGRTVAKILLGTALLAAVAAGGAFGPAWVKAAKDSLTAPSSRATVSDLETVLTGALVKIRADLPRKIDPTTVLTGVRNEGTKMIFDNLIVADVNKFDDAMKEKLRLSIIKNVCGGAETRRILDVGGSFRYLYADTAARPVMTVDVVQRMCAAS
jgi:GYF domain 2